MMAGYPSAQFPLYSQEIPQRHRNLDPSSGPWPPAQRHNASSLLYNLESSLPFNRPPIPTSGNNAAVSFLQQTFIPPTQSRLDFNSSFSSFPTHGLPTSSLSSLPTQRLPTSSFESFPKRGVANSSFESFPTQGLINSSFEPFPTQEQSNSEKLPTLEPLEPVDFIFDGTAAQTQESQQGEDLQAQIADKTSATQRTRISSAEWEKHKSTIKNLYLDQSQSLSATCKYMADKYGFDVP
jgi:Clr5 domain